MTVSVKSAPRGLPTYLPIYGKTLKTTSIYGLTLRYTYLPCLWGFIITGFKVHNGSSLPAALGMAGEFIVSSVSRA